MNSRSNLKKLGEFLIAIPLGIVMGMFLLFGLVLWPIAIIGDLLTGQLKLRELKDKLLHAAREILVPADKTIFFKIGFVSGYPVAAVLLVLLLNAAR